MFSRKALIAVLVAVGASVIAPEAMVGGLAAAGQTSAQAVGAADQASARQLLGEVLEAHGGLAKYRQFGGMKYEMVGFPLTPAVSKPSTSTVDLVSRNNRIESEAYTIGFDGKQAWSKPGPDAVGLPARFYSLGSFYFIGMPFVFADGGVVLTDLGTQTYKGKSYRVLNAAYHDGTGYTSKDDYNLFIDPATKRLGLINHSVTETGVARVTWEFPEWQTVNGLLVPAKLVFYPGFDANPKGEGAATAVKNVSFSAARPDASTYAPPAGAVIETK